MNQRPEAITVYGMMFGTPIDITLGEIDRLFRGRSSDELIAEAGFGVTIGTAFDRAFSADDPRTLAIAGTVFGPVALELDSRGLAFPIDDGDRLAAFELWKRILVSGDAYSQVIPTHRLEKMQASFWDAMQRIGPWGPAVIVGSLLQSLMVVESLLERRKSTGPGLAQPEVGASSEVTNQQGRSVQSTAPHTLDTLGGATSPWQPEVETFDHDTGKNDYPLPTDKRGASLFIAYAHKDSKYRDAFIAHLSPLRRQGKISDWYDRKIVPGQDWKSEIDQHLEQADLIVPLISAHFIASEYAYGIELQRALQKHINQSAIVVPVIIKPVHWHREPFADLQMLPTDAKPVATWKVQDNAWVTVVAGIERAISSIVK